MDDIDEEMAPPKVVTEEEFQPSYPEKVEEEGVLTKLGLKKRLVKVGEGWESPELGDEVTVYYTGTILGGTQFASNKDEGKPFVSLVGEDNVLKGCEEGLITMRKGEIAVFTVPPAINYGIQNIFSSIPADATLLFEVEMISWFKVVNVSGDGGVMKKILIKSEILERPQKKDEVTVKYEAALQDGSLVAKSPDNGIEFLVSDGHFCPAIAKAIVTMRKGEKALLQVAPQYAFGSVGRPAKDGLAAIPCNSAINVTLELVAFKLIEYVTEDMKVAKKITHPAETFEKPNSGAVVHIRYIAKLADGTIFDKKGYDGEEPLEFKVDEEQVIPGLDLAIATMKRKEIALVIIDPEYGFGNTEVKTNLAVIPPQSTLYYQVEMVDFTKVKESWDMEPEEKLEYAGKRKEEGNAYFKAGKYARASLRYDMATKYVEFDSTFDDKQKQLGKFFKATCNLNNAACKLKLKQYREAAKLCSKVLDLESHSIKALYRRAEAYIEITEFDPAEVDLRKALEIDPYNGEVHQLLEKLKKLQQYHDKKESKIYANMVAKLSLSDTSGQS